MLAMTLVCAMFLACAASAGAAGVIPAAGPWHALSAEGRPIAERYEATAQLHELIGMLPPDYESPAGAGVDARTVSTPVFGPGGGVVMVLSGVLTRMADVGGEESPLSNLAFTVARLRAAAAAVTEALHGAAPEGV